MNRLKNTRGYLCGAMDFSDDFGVGWRVEIRRELKDLGIIWLDPTDKPMHDKTRGKEEVCKMRKLMSRSDFLAVKEDMDEICRIDERLVDISDFLIVYLDMDIHHCGTYDELFRANNQRKPVLIVVKQGKKKAPTWLIGKTPWEMILNNWEELNLYLRIVSNAPKTAFSNRWIFFNFHGEDNSEAIQ